MVFVRRIITLLFLLFLTFVLTRALFYLLPGDPIDTLLAETATTLSREQLEAEFSRPLLEKSVTDFFALFRGDFGNSLLNKEPLAPRILDALVNSLAIAIPSALLAFFIAVTTGVRAAFYPSGISSKLCNGMAVLGSALPSFLLAPLLALLLGIWISLFPIENHWALPVIALSIGLSCSWVRLVKQRVKESIERGSVRGARARGVPTKTLHWKYGFLPVSGSLFAYFLNSLGHLTAGTAVIEIFFNWPGMGQLFLEGVYQRDFPLIETSVWVGATLCLIANTAGDFAYYMMNPKERT